MARAAVESSSSPMLLHNILTRKGHRLLLVGVVEMGGDAV